MTHQRLNRSEVVPFIEEGRGKSMPHYVWMDPLLDQCPFYHGLDEAVNSLWGQLPLLIWSMFPQCMEKGMIRISAVFSSLLVISYGEESPGMQWDARSFLPD